LYEDFLFLIPARGGSKGIPKKNIKSLCGKPLIYYTLDTIKDFVPIENICVSSDDVEIIQKVEQYGVNVPFIRPTELATDTSTTREVIEHALHYYTKANRLFRGVVLLQPTSPLRKKYHIIEAFQLFSQDIDLVVSVKITSANPYYVLYEENGNGFLELSKKGNYSRRQECPAVYELNGAIYIYNVENFGKEISRQKKYVMNEADSIDIDSEYDWMLAELILSKNKKISHRTM